ncbi:MAG: hypothetical protein D6734_06950 [Candidatus Schekmanbacteria bacterium]|nr:MAG: hypothetical protein D6734_06950 [Candidatus Schekmanbacteria bacterium]
MMYEIFISLKPQFSELIRQRKKTHEFRKYRPRHEIKRLWIYVTHPVSALKYIAEVGKLVEYPTRIPEDGVGNKEFNTGLKKSKYAFPILHLYELREPIHLRRLRNEFGFAPPQSFAYIDKYESLVEYVKDSGLRRLF